MKKDQEYVAKIEKAISQKYGKDTIQNPKNNWDDEKEEEHKEQIKKITKKEHKIQEKNEKIKVEGFFVSKKLLTREQKRTCPVCEVYTFKIKDDVYLNKFDCCYKCYVQWVIDREERWKKGWRPSEDIKKRLEEYDS